MDLDEAMRALLGGGMVDMDHSAVESSNLLAFQAAAQSLCWQRSWVPTEMSLLEQHSNTEYVP